MRTLVPGPAILDLELKNRKILFFTRIHVRDRGLKHRLGLGLLTP
jgi:hypothetical protein